MKKLLSGITGIIAIIAVICLLILFKGVSDIEKERATSHPLSDVISGENITSVVFKNGKVDSNGLAKRFTISDQAFISNIENAINSATILEQVDSLSVKKSYYDEKYMTLYYSNGKITNVTFYGTGDTLLGTGGKYYKIDYNPPGNEFISYFRDSIFSYDLVDSNGNVVKHVDGKDPLDIDLKEIQKEYKENWDNTPSILDPNSSGTPQDIYHEYWKKTPTILD